MNSRLLLAALGAGLLLLSTGCQSQKCGNGRVEETEQCDDGNSNDHDGCSNACAFSAVWACGNGKVEGSEACDDGNARNGDGCQLDCTVTRPDQEVLAECGNGTREVGEACDDGNTASGDGCESTCALTPAAVEQCPGAASLPAPEAGATCKVLPPEQGGNGARLYMGVVLMDGKTLNGGQVLVDAAGIIQCAACDCAAEPLAAEATRVSCPQGVISPGLINAHDHINYQKAPSAGLEERYEHRHDWRIGHDGHTEIPSGNTANADGTRWAELRQVMSGTTAVASSGGQGGLLRDLGFLNPQGTSSNQEGLNEPPLKFDTFPLGDSSGMERTSGCSYGTSRTLASGLPAFAAYLPHVSEGIEESARNEFRCVSGQGTGSEDLLTPRTSIIHGIGLTAAEIDVMAQRHAGLIWSPRSNVSLYGDTAMVTAYRQMGVEIALGTDWLQSGSMNMLRELQCADYLNAAYYSRAFTDEELWRMATASAADLTDSAEKLGRITKGKVADLAVFRLRSFASSPHRAVITANPEDVVLTLRGGKPLYGDQSLVTALTTDACDAVVVCDVTKAACLRSELGVAYEDLLAANTTAYPLFACGGQPQNEPTCTPQRASTNASWPGSVNGSTAYSGSRRLVDSDGDSIPNAQDNCPIFFNPVRPLDNGHQADTDGDGVGDACDPCPLAANSTSCTAANPLDKDGDGLVGAADNCPLAANVDQADTDGDGIGNACDLCATANPNHAPCPVSIYAVKKPLDGKRPFMLSQAVALNDVVVTGVNANGFFVQAHESDPGYEGPAWSAVFVYTRTAPDVLPGDRVDVKSALVGEYFGQVQLNGTLYVKRSSGNALPAPTVVTPADIRTGGPHAEDYEGVLVQVENVFVTKQQPPAVSGDSTPTDEFIVDTTAGSDWTAAGVRINDTMYEPTPMPAVGAKLGYVRGVLNLRNGNTKIEPRDAQDLAPALDSFGPTGNYVRVGTNGTTFPQALTVSLAGAYFENVTVTVTSSDEAALRVANAGQYVIPAGQTSVTVQLEPQVQASSVTLTASVRGSSLTTTVRVLGSSEAPALTRLSPNPLVTGAGLSVELTAYLDIPAPEGTTFDVSVPAEIGTVSPTTVNVTANAMTATFTFTASATPISTQGTITASLGTSTATSDVTLTADIPKLISLTPTTAVVIQGTTQQFKVTLDKAALADTPVKLTAAPTTAGNPFGTVPATVTVLRDATEATFDFTADPAGNTQGIVKATLNNDSPESAVTVRPPYPKISSVSPSKVTLRPDAVRTFTVTLDKGADPGGTTVALAIESTTGTVGTIPSATATINEGATTADVTFTAGSTDATGRLVASTQQGSSAAADIKVSPAHVVISEFASKYLKTDGVTTDHTDEFIELYNPTGADIDLTGWRLEYKSATGTTWAPIPLATGSSMGIVRAKGYFLFGFKPSTGGYTGAVAPDAWYTTSTNPAFSGTAHGGGHIRLVDAAGNEVDLLGWGTASAPEGVGAGKLPGIGTATTDVVRSYERKANLNSTAASMEAGGADVAAGNAEDSDINVADFVIRSMRDPQNSSSPIEP